MTSPSDNTLVARLRGADPDTVTAVDTLRLHDTDSATFPLSPEDVEAVLDTIDEAATALEAKDAENERLREALKPLAECIDRLAPGEDIAHWRLTDVLNHGLTVAHVISARTALKDSPK